MRRIKIDGVYVSKTIPARKRDSHKRMNGTVCVVGGSRLYHGAPFLCAMGAMRSGVDLVFLAVPAQIAQSVRALSPDLIVVPLPDTKLTRGNISKLLAWVRNVDVFAVGPGLGPQNPNEIARTINELKGEGRGLVIDADALRPEIIDSMRGARVVITPHAAEFQRLFGRKLSDNLDERVSIAGRCAKEAAVTLLLKGPTDIVTDGIRVGINETHTPAMTVGGTGDVLTGISAGLLSKGLSPFEAACCAAFVNGLAGVEAARQFGLHIVSSDVVNQIANVMKRFDRIE